MLGNSQLGLHLEFMVGVFAPADNFDRLPFFFPLCNKKSNFRYPQNRHHLSQYGALEHSRTIQSSKLLSSLHSLGRVSYLEGERNFAKGRGVCKLQSRKSWGLRADSSAVGSHLMGHTYCSSVTLGTIDNRLF